MKRRIFKSLFVAVVFLSGCAVDDYIPDNQAVTKSNHVSDVKHRGVTNFWVGRKASRLVAVKGEPDLIINAVPRGANLTGGVHTVCYIYNAKAGSVGACVDAYVVKLKTGTIIRYHCR